ncbi:hypothetical protein [Ramlibacter rhizophilus]|uniref:Uncharacterized protein n=1 Tax=Ramlibacter rhizophilus TaxID=1781167 RepID=A0A4Z0BXZ0_9BURK|nr:hypothetical protein [Ramlibacter rhizophilus]TFZ03384.1 hypothetical protein EZ242_05740 [Ramlibacter rhizophilus]
MPIDEELRTAVHQAVIAAQQPRSVETQLLALLTALSEGEVTAETRLQRVNLLKDELDLSQVRRF